MRRPFELGTPHFAVGVRVVHALVQERVAAVVMQLRCIHQCLLLALCLLLGSALGGAVQVRVLLQLLKLLAQGLLVRLHFIPQGDHLGSLLDELLVAVLLLDHLLLKLLLFDEHHLLFLLLPLSLWFHEVLTPELEHACSSAAHIIVTHANGLSLANPEGVIQIPGVALLFALMLAAELTALLLKIVERLFLGSLMELQLLVQRKHLTIFVQIQLLLILLHLLVLSHLGIQSLLVNSYEAALGIEDPLPAFELKLASPCHFTCQTLLRREAGTHGAIEYVGVQTIHVLRDICRTREHGHSQTATPVNL